MSDDSRGPSNIRSASGDLEPEIANAALRVGVDARAAKTAEDIWNKVSERVGRRGDFIVLQAQIADCGVAIFYLAAEDFVDDEVVSALKARLSQSKAPLNFLLQPSIPRDAEARTRLDEILAELAKRASFVLVPAETPGGKNTDSPTDEETLVYQVRFVSQHILSDPPPLSSVALKEFVSSRNKSKRKGKLAKADRRERPRGKVAESRDEADAAVMPADIDAKKAARQATRKTDRANSSVSRSERRSKKGDQTVAAADLDVQTAKAAKRTDDEKSEAKAVRKAQKESLKAERKSKKQDSSPEAALAADSTLQPVDVEKKDRSAKKAEKALRKAGREERKGTVASGEEPDSKEERKRKRAEKKKARANNGAERSDTDSEGEENACAPRIVLDGLGEIAAAKLRENMERAWKGVDVAANWQGKDKRSDFRVYAFDDPPANAEEIAARLEFIAKDMTKLRIFLGRAGSHAADGTPLFEAENRAIIVLAAACEGTYIDMTAASARYGAESLLDGDGLTALGYDFAANAVLGVVGGKLSRLALPRPSQAAPQDLADARTLAETPLQWLSQMTWNAPTAPRPVWARADKEAVTAFVDQKVALSEEETLDLEIPIRWPAECSGRQGQAQAFGLEFLSGPLAYWYSKANGRTTDEVVEIDTLLKERGVVASEILARAGKIIVDFAQNHPLSASVVWEESSVSRRARVLILYVLCCKLALKRKVKFDETICAAALRALLDLIEVLRSDDFYVPCSVEGVRQDCLLVGLALALRKNAYAERLLLESLDRLKRFQIEPGLTADGVWWSGSISDHCALLAEFKVLLADFDQSDVALIEPIAVVAKKMTVFAEAMMKSDGTPPVMGDDKQKSFTRQLSGMRRALAGAGFGKAAPSRKAPPPPRITETYVFREAQYFVSHSTKNLSPDSSLVALHADRASMAQSDPGGVTLAFAHGATDLLVRAEPSDTARRREKEIRYDPALRNGYHVNGAGFSPDKGIKQDAVRLVKSWRGPDWAAVKSIDEINQAASIKRVAIHLKAVHALIVVDELEVKEGDAADFEQFWHVAPGFVPSPLDDRLHFASQGGGTLTVVFDPQGDVAVETPENAGPIIHRSARLSGAVVASLFQWGEAPASASVGIERGAPGDWTVAASGLGFDVHLILAGDEFRCEPKA